MTKKFKPTVVNQESNMPDVEIAWKSIPNVNTEFLLDSRWTTVSNLLHIANPATGNITYRTYSLICTDFQMIDLPETISGIEVRIQAQRNGRICDEIVQLTYQGLPIGTNNFKYEADDEGRIPIKNDGIYGGSTELWDTELTSLMLQDPSFGVIIKLQSHPYYPHNCSAGIDAVSITVF